jgi:hypothetical protein
MSPKRNPRAKKVRQPRRNVVPRAVAENSAKTAENFAALKIVKAFKGPNHKYINTTFNAITNSTFTSTNPYITLLNGVVQGTTENTRIGRLLKMNWLDIDIQFSTTSWIGNSTLRFYIIAESTALGSALAAAQFFVDAATFTPFSQRDRTNRNASRYVALFDSKPFTIGGLPISGTAGFSASSCPAERTFSFHVPLNFSTDYSRGNAGTVADIDTNSLHLMVVTDQGTNGGLFYVNGGYTLCFTDDS